MKFHRVCLSVSIIFSLLIAGLAQEKREPAGAPPDKKRTESEAKAFELLAEVADEAAALKLAENRAFAFALIGGLMWEKDEKNARRLFGNAAAELISAQERPNKRNEFQSGDQEGESYWSQYVHRLLRERVVYAVMPKDAPTALEILIATRPAKLRDALDFYAQAGENPDPSRFKNEERRKLEDALTEMRMERTIKKEIVKNDPLKLAETVRENFSKGFDINEILRDLESLNKKDHDAAQKILDEMLRKLADTDFKNYWKSYTAYLLHKNFPPAANKSDKLISKDKKLEADEKSIKAVANVAFDDLLAQAPSENDFQFVEKALYLRKVLPERFKEIEAKYEKAKGNQAREWAEDSEATEKLGDSPTLPQIVENSSKLSVYSRTEYYKKAVGKLAETESREKIAPLLEKIPDQKDREKALDYLNSIDAEKNAGAQNASAAKDAALQIKSGKERFSKLISLAIFYQQKGGEENQEIAVDLMGEAGKLIKQIPETRTEHEQFLQFVAGYAKVRPAKAFDLIAPVIGRSNDLIDAFVLLGSYDDASYPYYSENEIVFAAQDGYSSYNHKYREIAKTLAAEDFERAKNSIKLFRREDVRLMAKLILIESILAK